MGEVIELTDRQLRILSMQRGEFVHYTGPLAELLGEPIDEVKADCIAMRDLQLLELTQCVDEEGYLRGTAWMTTTKGERQLELRDPVLIWSGEHQAWWRDGGEGYTDNYTLAGRFTRAEALEETAGLGPEKKIQIQETIRA